MARACTVIGGVLVVLGLAAALVFLVSIERDGAYSKAELASSRNPGNVMYEAEFGAARVRRGFQLGGVIAGVLVGLNGTTLVGLGVVADRLSRSQP